MPSPAARRSDSAATTIAARLFAASCLVVSGLAFVVGCDSDSERADKDVQRNINDAEPYRAETAIQKGFQKAATVKNASPATSAQARMLLAQAQAEQARQILRGVAQEDLVIARLAGEIADIAQQVNTNNTVVAGYQELSPKATTALDKELKAAEAQVKGSGADAKWTPQGAGAVPALSNAAARVQSLQGQIKDLETKRADLVKQRAAADAKAADLQNKSRSKQGKESVDLFDQGVAASKQSADLGNQVSQLDHELMKLKQDLGLAQAQSAELDAAVKSITAQIAANEKNQQETQQLIEAQKALSATLVNGEGGASGGGADKGDTATPSGDKSAAESGAAANPAAFQEKAAATSAPGEGTAASASDQTTATAAPAKNAPMSPIVTNASMAAKAKEMSTLVAHANAQRDAAIKLLTDALSNYDSALADAKKLQTQVNNETRELSVSKAPQKEAWKALADLYNPAKLNLQKAAVQQMLADLYRDKVISLLTRQQMLATVKPVLEEAGIGAPAGLDDPKLDAELQEAQGAANQASEATRTLLQEDVVDKPAADPAIGKAGNVLLVVNQYGRAQLAALVNDPSAEQLLSAARQTVSAAPDDFPPALRASLGVQAPSTAPSTTQPGAATQPGEAATQPAEGAPATAPTGAATEPGAAGAAPATAPGGTQ